MPKKFIILIVFILLLTIASGAFWWWQQQQQKEVFLLDDWAWAEVSEAQEYIIKTTPEGLIIKNEIRGLDCKLPSRWIYDSKISSSENYVSFLSPDTEESYPFVLQNGCEIVIRIRHIKTDIENLEKRMKKDYPQDEFEIIKVNNYESLKHTIDKKILREIPNFITSVFIPAKKYTYDFILISSINDKEECTITFNNFLKTILIN